MNRKYDIKQANLELIKWLLHIKNQNELDKLYHVILTYENTAHMINLKRQYLDIKSSGVSIPNVFLKIEEKNGVDYKVKLRDIIRFYFELIIEKLSKHYELKDLSEYMVILIDDDDLPNSRIKLSKKDLIKNHPDLSVETRYDLEAISSLF